jgi:hypothetical protein
VCGEPLLSSSAIALGVVHPRRLDVHTLENAGYGLGPESDTAS